MEPESPSPYSQVPATCPYPEPTTLLIYDTKFSGPYKFYWIPSATTKFRVNPSTDFVDETWVQTNWQKFQFLFI